LNENDLPISQPVSAVCEILGLDPLYIANEGKVLILSPSQKVDQLLRLMKAHKYGKDACVIGEVVKDPGGKVFMETSIGGQRLIDMLAGEQLPRIC